MDGPYPGIEDADCRIPSTMAGLALLLLLANGDDEAVVSAWHVDGMMSEDDDRMNADDNSARRLRETSWKEWSWMCVSCAIMELHEGSLFCTDKGCAI